MRSRYTQARPHIRRIYTPGVFGGKPEETHTIRGRRLTAWAPRKDFAAYITRQGDTLPGLATKFLGSPELWWLLVDFNTDVISDLFAIDEGITLVIPVSVE